MLGPFTFRAGAKKPLNAVVFSNFAHDTAHLVVENKTTDVGVSISLIRDAESGHVEIGKLQLGGSGVAMFSVGPNCDRVVVSGLNRDGILRIQVTSEAGGPIS